MPMTVVVTRDVAPRFRGFLASCMLEIAPGVYTSPNMTVSVRNRVWDVLRSWFVEIGGGGIVMTWRSQKEPGGQGIEILGTPKKTLHNADGLILAQLEHRSLQKEVTDVL